MRASGRASIYLLAWCRRLVFKAFEDILVSSIRTVVITLMLVVIGGGSIYALSGVHWRTILNNIMTSFTKESSVEKGTKDPPQDPPKGLIDVECAIQKVREVDALTERRKSAYGELQKCRGEWHPFSTKTPDQRCADKLDLFLKLKQEVIDRQAKGCSAAGK